VCRSVLQLSCLRICCCVLHNWHAWKCVSVCCIIVACSSVSQCVAVVVCTSVCESGHTRAWAWVRTKHERARERRGLMRHTLQNTGTLCNTLQHTATHCTHCFTHTASAGRGTATLCNTLQHTATHCYTLQHTAATHCITDTTSTGLRERARECEFVCVGERDRTCRNNTHTERGEANTHHLAIFQNSFTLRGFKIYSRCSRCVYVNIYILMYTYV